MKKAEMGVGTLIIFIAMLLVAAVAAGVLIQTSGTLQEKSLSTGDQAKTQISTNARVIEISATDGTDSTLTDFQEIVKLSPGSDPIKLSQIIFIFNTKDRTSTLKYRGVDGIDEKNNLDGYNTWNDETIDETLEVWNSGELLPLGSGTTIGPGAGAGEVLDIGLDLDDDGTNELIRTCDNTGNFCPVLYDSYFQFIFSNSGSPKYVYVQIVNDNGTVCNLSAVSDARSGFDFSHLGIIDENGVSYGFMSGYRDKGPDGNPYYIADTDSNLYLEIFEDRVVLEEDLDDDGLDDSFAVNATHAIFFLSSGSDVAVSFGSGVDISTAGDAISLSNEPVSLGGSTYAYLSIDATTTANDYLPAGSVIITPYRLGEGYFTAIYETEGTNHVAGNLQRGDVVRLCFESPGPIGEDSLVRLNFIPKIGTPTLAQFITPEVISTERVYLYP